MLHWRTYVMGLIFYSSLLSAAATQWIVKFKPDTSQRTFLQGVTLVDQHLKGELTLVEIPTHLEALQLDALQQSTDVEYVVSNITLKAFESVNDPHFPKQWGLNKVNASKAWELEKGSKETIVAVIDTGVDWEHEDLINQIWTNTKEIPNNGIDDDNNGYIDDVRGWDFHGKDNDPNDETSDRNPGHGTHCAGIVGAAGDNQLGISGMSQSVSILPLRFLGADGSGDLMNAVKAIDYAISAGVDVISASWGAAVPRPGAKPLIEAIERAAAAGVVFVAAAANDGKSNDIREVFPANAGIHNMISVAASNTSDGKPNWSNYGKLTVDLASPGEGIFSTLPGDQYGNLSGTSMATPLVAGLVALMRTHAREQSRNLAVEDYKAILQTTGISTQIETSCNCRIDAHQALVHLNTDQLTPVPAALAIEPGKQQQFHALGGTPPYSYSSSNNTIATISQDGLLEASNKGEVVITVKDAKGLVQDTHTLYVAESQGGGSTGQCPIDNPVWCSVMCVINPQLAWCQ